MPTRNIVKSYAPHAYYHIYSRGVNKNPIFTSDADRDFFLSLLKRYLSPTQTKRKKHAPYKSFAGAIDLIAYCLMDNHIHLLIYQYEDTSAMQQLMQHVMTSYSMYFNQRYQRVGPLFQSSYLASRIENDSYLHHISRYIHRNPKPWGSYTYSSIRYYRGEAHADWIHPSAILELFDNDRSQYLDFVADMDEDDEETVPDYLAHE